MIIRDKKLLIASKIKKREKIVKLINEELSKEKNSSEKVSIYLNIYYQLSQDINKMKGKI